MVVLTIINNGIIMIYYREKILLAILQEFNNSLSKTSLQKYLFLFTQMQNESSYNFVPHHFGCYSFQATKDLEHLIKEDLVTDNNNWTINSTKKVYKDELKDDDRIALFKIRKHYKMLTKDTLIRHVYLNYPYYTLNSNIKNRVLSINEIEHINNQILSKYDIYNETQAIFTIGYEGMSIEEYINKLLQNNIKVLVDVRKNPFSHKYGFSKKILQEFVEKFKIKYIHIPKLGILSDKRKSLETQKDYDELFDEYEKTLKNKNLEISYLISLLENYNRIALTCFEKAPEMCHRTRIKNHVIKKLKKNCDVIEL